MKKLLIVMFCVLAPFAGLCQKAYKAIHFTGKVKGLSVTFKLADGYPGGSELRIKNLKAGKVDLFLPGEDTLGEKQELAFCPEESKRKDFFVVKDLQAAFGIDLPVKLRAVYDENGKQTEFILKRIKR